MGGGLGGFLTIGDISSIYGDMFKKKAREKVLDFILWRPAKQFYEKEISEAVGVSKSMVNLTMVQLLKESWVEIEEKGRLNLFQANLNSVKVRSYKKNLTVDKLERLIKYLNGKVDKLILFGSAVKGEDSTASDLDIMVVSNQEVKMKRIRQLLPKDRRGQVIVKTADEFRELRSQNKVFYQAIIQGERLI